MNKPQSVEEMSIEKQREGDPVRDDQTLQVFQSLETSQVL